MNVAEIKAFIRAGRAVFTLQSARTGTHFTYRIVQSADKWDKTKPGLLFASVLIAPEVWGYLGIVGDGRLGATRGSKVSSDAPSFKALAWFLRQLDRGELPAAVIFRHEGRCGRCGHALTTPASVDTGLGPDCAAALGVPHEAQRGRSDVELAIEAYHAGSRSKLASMLTREPGEDESPD